MDGSTRKKIIRILFALFLGVGCVSVSHQQEEFLKANKLYAQGDYKKALELYESLESKGFGVYFNMGNAFYKRGDYVQALVNWKKAQRLAYGNQLKETLAHIKKAEEKLCISSHSMGNDLIAWCAPTFSRVSLVFVQFLWLLCVVGLAIVWYLSAGYKRLMQMLILIFAGISISGVLMVKRILMLPECAVVVQKDAGVFSGPNKQYHQTASLEAGNQVSICQQNGDWCKIATKHHVGWVSSSALHVI